VELLYRQQEKLKGIAEDDSATEEAKSAQAALKHRFEELREREEDLARAAEKVEQQRRELQAAGAAEEDGVLAGMDGEAKEQYIRIREREFEVLERRLAEKQAEVQQHIAANLKMSEALAASAAGSEMSAADVQKMIQNHAEELAHVQEISAARIQRLEEQVERAHAALDADKDELQDSIDELQEKLSAAETKLLQSFDDVERLARALQQQENGALEAAAAAQQRYVALREQMAAREQELVDEMLRKANAEHSDAAAAQTQLEQELQAKKLELKALEERDREEAKEKGLGKVVRSQSTKDAYWEVEHAARDLEQKQSEIAAANKELQELQQKQAQLIASNEEELRAERQRAEASQRARLEEMEREFQQRQASLQLQLATKETLQNALSPRTKVMQRRGTEAILGDLENEIKLEAHKLAGIKEEVSGGAGEAAAPASEVARPTTAAKRDRAADKAKAAVDAKKAEAALGKEGSKALREAEKAYYLKYSLVTLYTVNVPGH
jgi:hypothetical protein